MEKHTLATNIYIYTLEIDIEMFSCELLADIKF